MTSVATAASTTSRSVTAPVELRCGGGTRYRRIVGGVEYREADVIRGIVPGVPKKPIRE
jgi:uncharacterized protein YraI